MSGVRFTKRPVPTWLSQRSNSPLAVGEEGHEPPVGRNLGAAFVPSQSVKRVNWALASGLAARRSDPAASARLPARRPPRRAPRAPPTAASLRHRRRPEATRGQRRSLPDSAASIASISIRTSPISLQSLLRILGEAAAQEPSNRPQASPAGSADQSGSRSRIFAIVSETVSPGNGDAPGQHLVEHAAERPDVGALVDRLATRLLGAHVGGGADDSASAPPSRRTRCVASGRATSHRRRRPWPGRSPGPYDAVRRDLDVGGLQVAVDDPLFVRDLERLGDLPRDGQRFAESAALR